MLQKHWKKFTETEFCFRKTMRRLSRVRLVVLPSEELHQATKLEMERRYISSSFVFCVEYSNYWAYICAYFFIFIVTNHSRELSSKSWPTLKHYLCIYTIGEFRPLLEISFFKNYDLTLGMSGHLPNASGDYKMKQSMEHYKQTIIDPLVQFIQLNTILSFENFCGYSHQDSSAEDAFSISIVIKLQVRSNVTIPTPVIPDPRVPLGDFTSEHSRRIFKSEPLEHKTFKVWFTYIKWPKRCRYVYAKLNSLRNYGKRRWSLFLFSLPLRNRSSFLTTSLNRSTDIETWKQADWEISSR